MSRRGLKRLLSGSGEDMVADVKERWSDYVVQEHNYELETCSSNKKHRKFGVAERNDWPFHEAI